MNNIKKKYLVVALLTLSMSTTAQIEKNEWGFPKTYIPDLRQNSRVTTSVFFNDILHVGLEDNFKVEELRSIDPKMRNMKYEQYYKGLKEWNLSWNLEVTNATTGRKAASISLKEPTYLLDATGWETGIYVVRALVGEESLAGKITVK